MSLERQQIASLMANALAQLVLNNRQELNMLMAKFGYNTTKLTSEQVLDFIGQKVRQNQDLAPALIMLMDKKLQFQNYIGEIISGITQGLGSLTQGVQGIIDSTSDSGKQVRETQAQAALQAALAAQREAEAKLKAVGNWPIIVGIVGVVGLAGLGLFLYFKNRKKAVA